MDRGADIRIEVEPLTGGAATCTDTRSHSFTVRDSVRTEPPSEPYEAATKRFEVRLSPSQLARWQTIAGEQQSNLAELVRVAVDFASAHMPPGHVADTLKRESIERIRRALAEMPGRQQGEPGV